MAPKQWGMKGRELVARSNLQKAPENILPHQDQPYLQNEAHLPFRPLGQLHAIEKRRPVYDGPPAQPASP
jgi:hypothetical protein